MGARAVDMLSAAGHKLACFHRGEGAGNVTSDVIHLRGDRNDLPAHAAALRAFGPDIVLDMVALTERHASDLVETFRGHAKRLVVVSSMDVYRAYGRLIGSEPGPPDPIPISEDGPLRERLYPYRTDPPDKQAPAWAQDYDKILVERGVSGAPDLPATILRMPAVYGPNDGQHRVKPYLDQMDGGAAEIALPAAQAAFLWSRTYVDNAAQAICAAATDERASGRTYNVAEPGTPTEAEWVRLIGEAAGWTGPIRLDAAPDPDDPSDYSHHLVADSARIRRELGYAEAVPVREAIRRTVEWERRP